MFKNKWVIKIIRAIIIGSIIAYIFCPTCFTNPEENNFKVLAYYIISFFITYEIISFGVTIISKKFNWISQPVKMILANSTLILFIFLPINYLGVELNFGSYPERYSRLGIYYLKLNNMYTSIFIILYINSNNFLFSWKKAVLKSQELSKQQIKFELLALKNQINPHFLFNNLNTLSHLVSEDNSKAEEYIFEFSNIYRYLLDEKKKDMVIIEKEFNMLNSFIYLLDVKYGNNINFTFDKTEFKNFKIATFTLQLLIENAVKHNIITDDSKLYIDIFVENNYLIVKNNVLEKPKYIYSSGIGLNNIINRYKLLTDKSVIIEESELIFIVKIPII